MCSLAKEEAARAGVRVRELSPASPADLFILDAVVYYRPSGDPHYDAIRIRYGVLIAMLAPAESVRTRRA